jgi:hypothetical protein
MTSLPMVRAVLMGALISAADQSELISDSDWDFVPGAFLPQGHDVLMNTATVDEAKAECKTNLECAGFTYVNDKTKDKQQMFYKGIGVGKTMADPEGNWQTYLKSEDILDYMKEIANNGGKDAFDDKQTFTSRKGKAAKKEISYSADFDITRPFPVTLVSQYQVPVDVYRLKGEGGDGGTEEGITDEWELMGKLLPMQSKRVRRTKQGRKFRFVLPKDPSKALASMRMKFVQRYYVLEGTLPPKKVTTLGNGVSPVAFRYRNLQAVKRDLYFWDKHSLQHTLQHVMEPDSQTTTVAYKGHVFYWAPHNEPDVKLKQIEIVHQTDNFFVLLPSDEGGAAALAEHTGATSATAAAAAAEKLSKDYETEAKFRAEYFETNGFHWLGHHPKEPPVHFMWPAEEVGQVHEVTTSHSPYTCNPYIDDATSAQSAVHAAVDAAAACAEAAAGEEGGAGAGTGQCDAAAAPSGGVDGSKCTPPVGNHTFKIEVMATRPKVFMIKNFLSDVEVESINSILTTLYSLL